MADIPNFSVKEQSAKQVNTSGLPINERSPHSAPETNKCTHGMNKRNLIVCIDGTANQFGEKNTNVIELYNLILKKVEHNQRTWYNSGIGTYARPSWRSFKFYQQVLSHKIDLAIAWNFERTILAAYQWLSDNYEEGDCIFLFGFSRGAYQVRVLSAMIEKVGLIYKGNETQIPFAYELYADPKSDLRTATRVGSRTEKMSMAQRFKETFSYEDVKVHFVGAWDTVSSIGFARGEHMLPGTIDGMKHVCYFRHALALDERRVKYLPEYAYGGTTKPSEKLGEEVASPVDPQPPCDDKDSPTGEADSPTANNEPSDQILSTDNESLDAQSTSKIKSTENRPHTVEVWFAGTHSDIGGGNVVNVGMDRSRPPLRWMVFEAGALGLRTAPFERDLSPNEQIEIQESLTLLWWPLELFFFGRLTYTRRENGKKTTHKPHLGSPRKIHPGQRIHSSLTLTDKTDGEYTPKARPLGDEPGFWKEARTKHSQWLELDLYEYADTLVKRLVTESPGIAERALRRTAISSDGRQAVYEGVIGSLKGLEPNAKHLLLQSAMDILGQSAPGVTSLKLGRSIKILPLLSNLLESNTENYKTVMRRFLTEFTDYGILVMEGHTSQVDAVAYSPDGTHVVSGSRDKSVRIWDAETGKPVGEPLRGHTDWVQSVTFSPDGKHVASGSIDWTVQIWDAETGKPVGEPFRGHTDWVRSVAFSPDGKHVVSGSDDWTVQIWDAETVTPVGEPFRGHTDRVNSVAFSHDGKRIVSGSRDKTVRIWDAETGQPMGEPFRGHTAWVRSVAFSPDGKHVVSGSDDKTVQIWDAETRKLVGGPLRGHTDWVWSVAFSPDGRHILSVSDADTVLIWNAETGEQVREPFSGCTVQVTSIAFSSDGKYLVSGAWDGTIRIWDVEAAGALARL